jgi:hypothetical protein
VRAAWHAACPAAGMIGRFFLARLAWWLFARVGLRGLFKTRLAWIGLSWLLLRFFRKPRLA